MSHVEFRTCPANYRHWKLAVDGPVATLTMDVDEQGGLVPGYELKLNSYDLGVDIELYDAVQRLRFEHPEVKSVVVTSGKEKIFCAGANIRMLAASSHPWKVNFCKFTNETRNGIEDATENSGQTYLAALNGTASGGGYELALACDQILLVDDRSSAVSLPELPLLGVLPGTGGLTRVVDKRHVRRDLADYFSTKAEGLGGKKAVAWKLVDEAVPRVRWKEAVAERSLALASASNRLPGGAAIELTALDKSRTDDAITYPHVSAALDRTRAVAEITVRAPDGDAPESMADVYAAGASFWPLAVARELDDLILDLRTNETEIGTWVLRTTGDVGSRARPDSHHPTASERVLAYDGLLLENAASDWLANEIVLYLKRTLKRLDVTSRSLIALIEPGSCFAGSLLELALAADRSYMLFGVFEDIDPDAGAGRGERGPDEPGPAADGQRPDPAADPVPGRRGRPGRRREARRRAAGGRGGREARPDHLRARRHRLGGGGADRGRGAVGLLPRRVDGPGGELPVRGPGDDRDQDLRPADRLAELDFLPPERLGARRRAARLRHRQAGRFRPEASLRSRDDHA